MSTKELLKPRYKVIANYPSSEMMVDEIIEFEKPCHRSDVMDDYPHLFRKLEWWEERAVEDMPQYLKETGMVDDDDTPIADWYLKVKKHFNAGNGEWRDNSIRIFCTDDHRDGWAFGNRSMSYSGFEPATEAEYLSNLAQLESANK